MNNTPNTCYFIYQLTVPPFLFTSRTPRRHHFLCCSRWLQNLCKITTNHHRRSKSLPHCISVRWIGILVQQTEQKSAKKAISARQKLRRVASRSYLNHRVFRRKHFCCLKFSSKSSLLFEPDCTEWTAHMTNAWFYTQQQTRRSLFWRFPSHVKSLKSNVLHLALNWMWRHTNFLFHISLVPKENSGSEAASCQTPHQYPAVIKMILKIYWRTLFLRTENWYQADDW